MINLFYHPGYAKRKKTIFALSFKNSRLFNLIIDLFYIFNIPVPSRYITNGPHKLMNNLVRTFRNDKKFKFNKFVYSNTYVVQFDKFGENVLKKIIDIDDVNKKVLIGPLYTLEQLKSLIGYFKQYEYIYIAVASKASLNILIKEIDPAIDKKRIVVMPTGVVSQKNLENSKSLNRNNRCLIYFKNRTDTELQLIKNMLKNLNLKFDLFEYKNYNNNKLIKQSKVNKFGILLTTTESQGFAVQEMMSNDLPLIVWDSNTAMFGDLKVSGTSVPFWDNRCGIKVSNFQELEENIAFFLKNLSQYRPSEMIKERLTFEVVKENLIRVFE